MRIYILELDNETSFTVSPIGTGDLIAWMDQHSDEIIWADEAHNSIAFDQPGSCWIPLREHVCS